MEAVSPFMLPPSAIQFKKRSLVDYYAEGVRVEWSDDDELPVPKKRNKKKAQRPRVVVASADSLPTALLASRNVENVYFVPVDRSLRGRGRGATELADDPLTAVAEAAEVLQESDSVVIVAGDHDRAATLARMVAKGMRFSLPMPADPELERFCKKLNSLTPVTLRDAFRRLEAFRK